MGKEKEKISLVIIKLEANDNGLSVHAEVKNVVDVFLGEERGKAYEDFFVELFEEYKIGEMMERMTFKFAELAGSQIDATMTIDGKELEKQIEEAQGDEI